LLFGVFILSELKIPPPLEPFSDLALFDRARLLVPLDEPGRDESGDGSGLS
jgi:hypothetical protein